MVGLESEWQGFEDTRYVYPPRCARADGLQDPEKMKQLNAAIPLGRMAGPKEIADLVMWVASDEASYVNANTFFMDGGMMRFSAGL